MTGWLEPVHGTLPDGIDGSLPLRTVYLLKLTTNE